MIKLSFYFQLIPFLESSFIHPYLTLWDKISQNLTHLEANSHQIFQILQNFQAILQHIFLRSKHKSHTVVLITSFLHLNEGFCLIWGSSRLIFVKISQNFIKSDLKICLISQISVHSLWHVCSLFSVHITNVTSTNFWKKRSCVSFFCTNHAKGRLQIQ